MFTACFVIPSWHFWKDPLKHTPYWELYYATYIKKAGFDTDVVDIRSMKENHKDLDLKKIVNKIPERNFYFYWIFKTGDALEIYLITKLLKKKYPKSIHAAGGTHVDMCQEECVKHFDSIIVGPGEESFINVIKDYNNNKLLKKYSVNYKSLNFRDTNFPDRSFLSDNLIANNKMFSHHGSDPLNDGKAHGAFDVMQSRLGFSFNDAVKYASKASMANHGQTIDQHNKSVFKSVKKPAPAPAAANIEINELGLFNDELLPVLPVPYTALPVSIEVWARDVSNRVGCAPDYLIVCALTVLSSLLGRKLAMKPKQKHDWIVIPNLWGAIVGRPSTKKSPALNEALYYINQLEVDARSINEDDMKLYSAEARLLKIEAKGLEKKAGVLAKTDKQAAILLLAAEAEEIPKPAERRFIAHDTTVEKLACLMQDNPNGLLTIRDEVSGLLAMLDRDEKATDRAFYLQMFNGNQSYSYDRITRESVNIPHCVGSILGGIQPAVLKPYLMAGKGKSEDGLLQRIQLIVYPDAVISTGADEAPDQQAKARLTEVFEFFANLPETADGETPQTVSFTYEAQQIFYEWESENACKARAEKNPSMDAHLSRYPALIASLALIIHLADNREVTPVNELSLLKAIELTKYLETHARRIYGLVFKTDKPARALADNLHKLNNPFKLSDFKNKGWAGLATTEMRAEALAMLVARGYIAKVKQTVAKQRKPVAMYYQNPLLDDE